MPKKILTAEFKRDCYILLHFIKVYYKILNWCNKKKKRQIIKEYSNCIMEYLLN